LSISAILISASGLATAQSASPSGRFLDEVEEDARNKSTLPGDNAVEEERLETIFVTNPAYFPMNNPPTVILSLRIACILFTASWLQAASAQSEPIAQDPLDYSSGGLKGQTGGSGWKEPWGVNPDTAFDTTENGIMPTTEEGAYNQGTRTLSSPTPDAGAIYFSIEIQTSDMKGQYHTAFQLHQSIQGEAERSASIGIQNGRVYVGAGLLALPEGEIEDVGSSGTFILVGKIEFTSDSKSNLSVWVNPHDESDHATMKTFPNVGLANMPFVLVELNAVKLAGASGDITFRNLVVSTEWPVPLEK
jgi:hypothetical protein